MGCLQCIKRSITAKYKKEEKKIRARWLRKIYCSVRHHRSSQMLLLCKREIDKSHHYHEATVGFITAAMNGFFALHHIMRNATTNKLQFPTFYAP